MILLDFVASMRLDDGALRFGAPALDAYFAAIFPEPLRADPPRFAFAAAAHAGLMTLTRHLVEQGLAIGLPGRDELALRAAATGIRADIALAIGGPPATPGDRLLRCLLFEAPAPALADPAWPPVPLPPADDSHGIVVVGLLPAGEAPAMAPAWQEGHRFDLPGFALLVRP